MQSQVSHLDVASFVPPSHLPSKTSALHTLHLVAVGYCEGRGVGTREGAPVGQGVTVGTGLIEGAGVGMGVGNGHIPLPVPDPCVSTPQGGVADSHIEPWKAESKSTLEWRHQPKSWLKAEA